MRERVWEAANVKLKVVCDCQPDLAHFDTQIWPPYWTNSPSWFPLLAAFRSAGRSEAQRRFCGAFGRSVGRCHGKQAVRKSVPASLRPGRIRARIPAVPWP
jgi:hypothetical protein